MKPLFLFVPRLPQGNALAAASTPSRFLQKTFCITLLTLFTAGVAMAQGVTANPDGWVVLPVTEYTALRHAALPG